MSSRLARLACVGAFLLSAPPLSAQAPTYSYSVLHAFENPPLYPGPLIDGHDGFLYGTTAGGGLCDDGTVFRLTPSGDRVTLYAFSGLDGSGPNGLVAGPNGDFFGTTNAGGLSDSGTIFRITRAGILATLHSFTGGDGVHPVGSLVWGPGGALYGMTGEGASGLGWGTVFRATQSGEVVTLCRFRGYNGLSPHGALVRGLDGNFYGTTGFGGTYGNGSVNGGTVFRMTAAGSLTTLHSFSGLDGGWPYAGLAEATDGNLYGTTSYGGESGLGTVFRITKEGVLTTLWSFSGDDGGRPLGPLLQATNGDLYGTTSWGWPKNEGTIFRVGLSGPLTTVHAFGGPDGSSPKSALVQTGDGTIYGTTTYGGWSGAGTLFTIAPDGASFSSLMSFAGGGGRIPRSPVVEASDGSFYGTTAFGGAKGFGTIFRIAASGSFSTLASFAGTDGSLPDTGLVEGRDGDLYGTAPQGGTQNLGSVFRVTKGGFLTALHSFAGYPSEGNQPSKLILAADGDFYGATTLGGSRNRGTLFRVKPSGIFDTLSNFDSGAELHPRGGLVQGLDLNLYGVSSSGDLEAFRAFFKMTPGGTLTSVGQYYGPPAVWGDLLLAADGNFYGAGDDSIFRIAPGGTLFVIHSFASETPNKGLVQGRRGDLFGTSSTGVFGVTLGGVFTDVHSFGPGLAPTAGVVEALDGALYGTTSQGGPLGGGVIFRLATGAAPPPRVTAVDPPAGLSDTFVTISGSGFQPGALVTFDGQPASAVTFISAITLTAITPAHGSGAADVVVSNPDAQNGVLAGGFTYTCGTLTAVAAGSASIPLGGSTLLTGSGAVTCAWTPPEGLSDATSCTPLASPPLTTTYALVVADRFGCASHNDAAATVTVIRPSSFVVLAPCRLYDSRANPAGALAALQTRRISFAGVCSIAFDARAIVVNVTVVDPSANGVVATSPGDPATNAIEFPLVSGRTRAASAILALGKAGDLAFRPSAGTVHLVLDVSGYFR